jgi:hypothetical protein
MSAVHGMPGAALMVGQWKVLQAHMLQGVCACCVHLVTLFSGASELR